MIVPCPLLRSASSDYATLAGDAKKFTAFAKKVQFGGTNSRCPR
jgi:hypothetical protein